MMGQLTTLLIKLKSEPESQFNDSPIQNFV